MTVDQNAFLVTKQQECVLEVSEYEYESETNVMVVKYNFDGERLWSRSFGTKEFDLGTALDVDNKHNIYVAACLDVSKYQSPVLRKYTSEGHPLEQTVINNLKQPAAFVNDMAVYRAGEFYFAGNANRNLGAGYEGGYSDAFLARVDGKGNRVWVR